MHADTPDPAARDPVRAPRFPAERAFVVQFGTPDPCVGRVEHVVSGRARRFHTETELLSFMTDVLTSLNREGLQGGTPS